MDQIYNTEITNSKEELLQQIEQLDNLIPTIKQAKLIKLALRNFSTETHTDEETKVECLALAEEWL